MNPHEQSVFDISNIMLSECRTKINTDNWENKANIIVPFVRTLSQDELMTTTSEMESDEELDTTESFVNRHERAFYVQP